MLIERIVQHEIATVHKFGSYIVGIHHATVHYLTRINPCSGNRNGNLENGERIGQFPSVLFDFSS